MVDGNKIPVVGNLQEQALAKDREHQEKLDHEIELRVAQEQDRTKGEPVWFSRRIFHGSLHHWAIFTHDKKYELRLPQREISKLPSTLAPHEGLIKSIVPSLRFEAKISPWTMRNQAMHIRNMSIVGQGKPHTGDYYVCQIGWTKLTAKQVDDECQALQKEFGVYVLGFRDCQTFLKHFAQRIIEHPGGQALDYPWFATNTETPYHLLQQVEPDANVRRFQKRLVIAVAAGGTVGTIAIGDAMLETDEPTTKGEMMDSSGGGNDHSGGGGGGGEDSCGCDCGGGDSSGGGCGGGGGCFG